MNRDVALSAGLLVVVAAAVVQSLTWPSEQARLFPLTIGIPLLVLLLVQLVLSIRSARRRAVAAGQAAEPEPPETAEAPGALSLAEIIGWLAGFAVAIWALGFPFGGTLMTLAYLKLAARERWPMALAITAGTAVFFLLTSMLLNVPYPPGALVQLLGGEARAGAAAIATEHSGPHRGRPHRRGAAVRAKVVPQLLNNRLSVIFRSGSSSNLTTESRISLGGV